MGRPTPEHIQRLQKRSNEFLDRWERRGFSTPGEIILFNAWMAIIRHFDKQEQQQKINDRQKQLQK